MARSGSATTANARSESTGTSAGVFDPITPTSSESSIHLPGELWLTVLSSPCTFPPAIFSDVMLNLISNPNITASYLFRADVCYDSDKDFAVERDGDGAITSPLLLQMRAGSRPLAFALDGYQITRTIVRKLIPRNPQLDNALVQTCHFLSGSDGQVETAILVYIPHVQHPSDIPFYHPAVSHVAFSHVWRNANAEDPDVRPGSGVLSISYKLFPETELTTKLERTALRLLQTAHKHGQGQLSGYEKRVHLDQVIPQKRYQDTYTHLKAKYGKHLAEQWVEVTDPGKHVFEDIGIAAFLIELWRDMYSQFHAENRHASMTYGKTQDQDSKSPFPGFVDIGCGNGVLVYLLLSEGYHGWGFDARERKTWQIFPESVQQKLCRQLLVPQVFQEAIDAPKTSIWHNGLFKPGTFIISNHADELTVWTPLLAYLNRSAFVAIPCCSHDFAGARFRAPACVKAASEGMVRLPQQTSAVQADSSTSRPPIAETGSLRRTVAQQKMQSAYSTLCSYVASLAEEVGFEPEKDVLRIPSTRNQCILGRHRRSERGLESEVGGIASKQTVIDIVEREMKTDVHTAAIAWVGRVEKLSAKPASGH